MERLKQTLRLKDYAFIGALATQLPDPVDQIRFTLDGDHLADLLARHPQVVERLSVLRPSCSGSPLNGANLAVAIDAEIRALRHADEQRIQAYSTALLPWAARFRSLDLESLPLAEAHDRCCAAALGMLPQMSPWP